jgi:hypothetical protein
VGGKNQPSLSSKPTWQEGAGSLLLLAAAHETGLISGLSQALPPDDHTPRRLAHARLTTRQQSLLTLLFLPAVGLRRTCDLSRYTGDALGLLTGRWRAYGFWQIERFLSQLARCGGDQRLTDALAVWTSKLWSLQRSEADCQPPAFYVDGHRKPVYSDHLIPRGQHSAHRQGAGRTHPPAPARRAGASTPGYHPPWGSPPHSGCPPVLGPLRSGDGRKSRGTAYHRP